MLQIHASLGTLYVSLVFPRSHNKLQFRWLLRPGQSQRFLSKIYFHFASVFGNIIDLGKRIHTLTMGTGHVIKNSLILPQQNSIPNKLASYTILSFTKSNENWRAPTLSACKKKLPKRMQVISTCLCMASFQRAPASDRRKV